LSVIRVSSSGPAAAPIPIAPMSSPNPSADDGRLGFLKLTGLPADAHARRRLLDTALTAINDFPELAEVKRPSSEG
jgi:hypothetical protein